MELHSIQVLGLNIQLIKINEIYLKKEYAPFISSLFLHENPQHALTHGAFFLSSAFRDTHKHTLTPRFDSLSFTWFSHSLLGRVLRMPARSHACTLTPCLSVFWPALRSHRLKHAPCSVNMQVPDCTSTRTHIHIGAFTGSLGRMCKQMLTHPETHIQVFYIYA